jgi:tetratricopeptide (TPR) repeat protein
MGSLPYTTHMTTSREQTRETAFQAFKDGRHDEAEALLLDAVRAAEAPDVDPARLIERLQELASLYRRLYRHTQREETLTRLLALQEATLGEHHPDLAGTLRGLAWEIGTCGQTERSEALYRRSLAIVESTRRPDHPDVAYSLRVLGVCLFFSDQYDESAELLERARAILEAPHRPPHRVRPRRRPRLPGADLHRVGAVRPFGGGHASPP